MQYILSFIQRHLKQTFSFIAFLSTISLLLSTIILLIVSRNYSNAVDTNSKVSNFISQIIDLRRIAVKIEAIGEKEDLSSEEKHQEFVFLKELLDDMLRQVSSFPYEEAATFAEERIKHLIDLARDIKETRDTTQFKTDGVLSFAEATESLQDDLIANLKSSLVEENSTSSKLKNVVISAAMIFLFFIILSSILSKGVLVNLLEQQNKIAAQQNQLMAQSNLASLGELAGGIAHEINTPLSAVVMRASHLEHMLEEKEFDSKQFLESSKSIAKSAEQIAKIIASLKLFSHQENIANAQSVAISSVISSVSDLYQHKFEEAGIAFSITPFAPEVIIECWEVKIRQVLINLLNNAFYAVKTLPEKWIKIDCAEKGGMLEIAFTDSGAGIDPAIADRIMQPFFTTKPLGEGTGLGLSIAYGIAKEHQGSLELDRTSSNTRFVLSLPRKVPT